MQIVRHVYMSFAANKSIPRPQVLSNLLLHNAGLWGDVDATTSAANKHALETGRGRVVSKHISADENRTKFFIQTNLNTGITEIDVCDPPSTSRDERYFYFVRIPIRDSSPSLQRSHGFR